MSSIGCHRILVLSVNMQRSSRENLHALAAMSIS
jgi:hypothetical protein